jgi:hypothetical protein
MLSPVSSLASLLAWISNSAAPSMASTIAPCLIER